MILAGAAESSKNFMSGATACRLSPHKLAHNAVNRSRRRSGHYMPPAVQSGFNGA